MRRGKAGGQGMIRRFLTDLLFPPRCAGCGELLPPFRGLRGTTPSALCDECRPQWERARSAYQNRVRARDEWHIRLVPYHPQEHDGVPERVIFRIKHQDDRRLIEWITAELAVPVREVLREQGQGSSDVICLYPPRRRAAVREDGFDQARSLARGLARQLDCPCLPIIHRRSDGAGAQKELDAAERWANAESTYTLDEKLAPQLHRKWVLLVDDLSTTGATLGRLAALARSTGATGVMFVTVAQTEKKM